MSLEGEKELDIGKEKEYIKKIEAALFISGKWMTSNDLIMLTDINPILLKQLMNKLVKRYSGNSAMEILVKENKWKMDVSKEYTHMVNKLATGSAEFSKAEQASLALIAYKQPIKQSVLVKIRGNKAYEHVKKFTEVGLVKGKKLGRTKELVLSDEFYDYFKISKLENLKNLVKDK